MGVSPIGERGSTKRGQVGLRSNFSVRYNTGYVAKYSKKDGGFYEKEIENHSTGRLLQTAGKLLFRVSGS